MGLVNPRRVARLDHETPLYECVALCSSDSNVEEDLEFEKGDILEILAENHPSPKWLGRRKRGGGSGEGEREGESRVKGSREGRDGEESRAR